MRRIVHFTWAYRVIIVFILAISGGFFYAYGMQTLPDYFQVGISLEKSSEIHPQDPIIINFSNAVRPQSYDGKIKIIPSTSAKLDWKESGKNDWRRDLWQS